MDRMNWTLALVWLFGLSASAFGRQAPAPGKEPVEVLSETRAQIRR